MKLAVVLLAVAVCPGAFANGPGSRTLTADERARVQAALNSVDELRRVDTSETAMLEAFFDIEPTADALHQELSRLAEVIHPPERLEALYDALGNDWFLIEEGVARAALVDRVSRDLYAFDPAIHAGARAQALDLRARLLSGALSPLSDYPGRLVFDLPRSRSERLGGVSEIQEERDGFVLSAVLSETTRGTRVAKYVVSKTSFETWRGAADAVAAKPSDPDLFAFCAPEGSAVALTVTAPAGNDTPGSASRVALLDDLGEPVPSIGDGWRAPRTGAYFAQIARDQTQARDAYLLAIGIDGQAAAPEIAELSLTADVAPEPVYTGGLITYTILVYNAGPDLAANVEMLEILPDATTFESITVPSGTTRWDCPVPRPGGRGKISCLTKCFGSGETSLFSITVRVESCLGSTTLSGTASVSTTSIDPLPGNNQSTEQSTILDIGVCDDGNSCTVGDHCVPGSSLEEDFDGVPVFSMPPGWTTTLVAGPEGAQPWRLVTSVADSEPNSAFTPDAGEIRDSVLDSPPIPIVSPSAQLIFRNRYDLERDQDGGVLEISVDGGEFEDILAAGGSFVTGGYTSTISEDFSSPIGGRRAWSGRSSGFVTTTVGLPAAASGKSIVLRWRMATDRGLGAVGQWIDSVVVLGRNVCEPGAASACDDHDACTSDTCDPIGGCVHAAISCNDGNVCTDDSCDSSAGCVHAYNTVACDDHNACTQADFCALGACLGSSAVICHDADICTVDTCDPTLRCVATTANFDTLSYSSGRVDGRDLAVLAAAWNTCPGNPRYNAAANLDRQVACINGTDFHLFMDIFGRDCTP